MTNHLIRLSAASIISLCSTIVLAQTGASENILVTATRLDPINTRARGNTTIITATDIENSTAQTLPELLGREAGASTQ